MAAAPPLLQLSDIWLTFGGEPLLEGAELAVGPGERVALVGRNGSQVTLLRIAAGIRADGASAQQPARRCVSDQENDLPAMHARSSGNRLGPRK